MGEGNVRHHESGCAEFRMDHLWIQLWVHPRRNRQSVSRGLARHACNMFVETSWSSAPNHARYGWVNRGSFRESSLKQNFDKLLKQSLWIQLWSSSRFYFRLTFNFVSIMQRKFSYDIVVKWLHRKSMNSHGAKVEVVFRRQRDWLW